MPRIEVNRYHWKPRGPLKAIRVVTLCELCRLELRGTVLEVEWGAEMSGISLSCVECGYIMERTMQARTKREQRLMLRKQTLFSQMTAVNLPISQKLVSDNASA
ncbi:MAG: hypothetical protein V7638_3868 [Acidobacteriota bacterium]|jgi:hypothetical protein